MISMNYRPLVWVKNFSTIDEQLVVIQESDQLNLSQVYEYLFGK